MIACAVTDLPEPDSPTSATVLPGRTRSDRLFTACTRPAMVRNSTDRSRMRQEVVGRAAWSCGFIGLWGHGFRATGNDRRATVACLCHRGSWRRTARPQSFAHAGAPSWRRRRDRSAGRGRWLRQRGARRLPRAAPGDSSAAGTTREQALRGEDFGAQPLLRLALSSRRGRRRAGAGAQDVHGRVVAGLRDGQRGSRAGARRNRAGSARRSCVRPPRAASWPKVVVRKVRAGEEAPDIPGKRRQRRARPGRRRAAARRPRRRRPRRAPRLSPPLARSRRPASRHSRCSG